MRILLVEDDMSLGAALAQSLQQAGYDTTWVRRLADAARQLAPLPAVVVLDVNLPDGEGFALLDQLRRGRVAVPVLIMTARDALPDRLRGLDGGADDYLVKPFAVSELLARLRAILRRGSGQASDTWTFGDLHIDTQRQRVTVGGAVATLTPTEYRLLVELARAGGRVLTKEWLIENVWSHDGGGSDAALEVQVHGLRKRVGAARIRTVRGSGYALEIA